MRRNYQRELDAVIAAEKAEGRVPRLFLHSCCAPCSSYVLEYLSQHFRITDFFYNPNITDPEEYALRLREMRRLVAEQEHPHEVTLVEGPHEPETFLKEAAGLEHCREGGERCMRCFRLRLLRSAKEAAESPVPYDYLSTTLTISPLKNAEKLNEIGEAAAETYGLKWLPSDFKKRDGYRRSIELSAKYGLYRQNYCGCLYSRRQREEDEAARAAGQM